MVPHIHTVEGITVVLFGKPYHAAKDEKFYQEVVDLVNDHASMDEILAVFERTAKVLQKVDQLSTNLSYNAGVILYQGEALHNYATEKLIDFIQSNKPIDPLVNFIENLMKNPSKRVVDSLYRFLEKGRMPITEDGHFLAYKKVNSNYKDIHSGKFDNSVGSMHEMPRNRVDEDPNRTCSYGFHVCSYDYLDHFGGGGGNHVMVCKINPADVVAIPADYNDTKMRVAKYVVTDEVTDYYQAGENVLTKQSVSAEQRDYVVKVIDGGGWEDEEEEIGRFWTEEEAIRVAEEKNESGEYRDVWVECISGQETIWTNW